MRAPRGGPYSTRSGRSARAGPPPVAGALAFAEDELFKINVNGQDATVDVDADMPLLWVLRDTLNLTGTKFGCGMALCGACTVHLDAQPVRACVTPISAVAGKKITTIEGLSADSSHPVQRAWIEAGRAAVRLLPVRPDHVRRGAVGAQPRSPRMRTSMPPWRVISAAAAPISASAPPFTAPRNLSPAAERAAFSIQLPAKLKLPKELP